MKAVYFTGGADPAAAIKNIAADMTMHEPARLVARLVAAAGQPAWLYRFGHVDESLRPKAGAEHSSELPHLFGTLNVTATINRPTSSLAPTGSSRTVS